MCDGRPHVGEAHWQVPIAKEDWQLLGCHVQPGTLVFVHTAGTFGVASASCHLSRVASALGRLSQDLAGESAHTWHMLVDDYRLDAGGAKLSETLFWYSSLQVIFVGSRLPGARLQAGIQ